MKLSASLVPVRNITCLTPQNFDDGDLDRLARQILSVEGIISPLIVRKTGIESYELIDGYFEYYAAIRAREIDPRKGTMISAFIVEPTNLAASSAIEEQVELLRKSRSGSVTPPIDTDAVGKMYAITEEKLATMLEQAINPIATKIKEKTPKTESLSESDIDKIATKIKEKTSNSESLSESDIDKIATKIMEKTSNSEQIAAIQRAVDSLDNKIEQTISSLLQSANLSKWREEFTAIKSQLELLNDSQDPEEKILKELNDLDDAEVKAKLKSAGVRANFADKIIAAKHQKKIVSFKDKIDGVGPKTIQNILNGWKLSQSNPEAIKKSIKFLNDLIVLSENGYLIRLEKDI